MSKRTYQQIEAFEAVCADPYQTARTAEAAGQKVAGFACTYSPQELFHAGGFFPVRLMGRFGGTQRADELLQAYACSFARSTLDSALAGELDFLNLIVFSHTCDTMQNLAELWKRNRPTTTVLTLSVPTLTEGEPSLTYFRRSLDRVRDGLEEACGEIPDSTIMDSIRLYEHHRAAMQRLYAFRRAHPERVTGREMHAVVTSSLLMRREDHLELLTGLLDELDGAESNGGKSSADGESSADGRTPLVMVAGSVCQNMNFIGAIEEAGCTIVDDDLCMGSRAFALPEAAEGDPLDALAQTYLARTPCPAFHRPSFDPGKHLVHKAQRAEAEGVIFLLTKFCDPWAFDYVPMNKALEEAGIPTLVLEVEQHLPPLEQFRTRTEAFVEMLQSRTAS